MMFKKPKKWIPKHRSDFVACEPAENPDTTVASAPLAEVHRTALADLHANSVFPPAPNLAISLLLGIAFATLAYTITESPAGALLTGITIALASIALNEASYLRKQAEALLRFLEDTALPPGSR